MAEQQAEDPVQEIEEVEDEEDNNKHQYKAPAQKSVQEIKNIDADDESLQKYKKALLGDGDNEKLTFFPGEPRVILRKMAIVVPDREDAEVDMQNKDALKNMKFDVKEGAEYCLRISFHVQEEICSGLRLVNIVKRMGKTLSKDNFMVGSYAPKEELYTFQTKKDVFPSGMLARGEYKVTSLFTDDDKNEICKWDWTFKIKKDWKD